MNKRRLCCPRCKSTMFKVITTEHQEFTHQNGYISITRLGEYPKSTTYKCAVCLQKVAHYFNHKQTLNEFDLLEEKDGKRD